MLHSDQVSCVSPTEPTTTGDELDWSLLGPRDATRVQGISKIRLEVPLDLVDPIMLLVEQVGVSSRTVLFSAWAILLTRSLRCDVLPVELRDGAKGMRIEIRPSMTVRSVFSLIEQTADESSSVTVTGNAVVLQLEPESEERSDSWHENDVLAIWCHPTDLVMQLAYEEQRLERTVVERWPEQWKTLLERLGSNLDLSVNTIPWLSADDRKTLLAWSTEDPYTSDHFGLLEQWEHRVQNHPQVLAVSWENGTWTYRELDRQANAIAFRLEAAGYGPSTPIALWMERGPLACATVLAILKVGGVCVPIDPYDPIARQKAILESSQVAVILTDSTNSTHNAYLPHLNPVVVEFVTEFQQLRPRTFHQRSVDSKAYIVFTSGSSGQPKGVAISDCRLANLITWQQRSFPIAVGQRVLHFAALSFDVAFQELFSTWFAGGTLILISQAKRQNPEALLDLLIDQAVERLYLPFVMLDYLAVVALDRNVFPNTLQMVITAGEALQITPSIRRFFEHLPNARLVNQYGPSETHVATSYALPDNPDTWPVFPAIGCPIANTTAWVVDGELQLVPPGIPGELLLGGIGLSEGYLQDQQQTRERFLSWSGVGFVRRVYRTGDLVRWSSSGRLEFLGRLDDQVKIRGHRVDPGEVEAVLRSFPGITAAVVTPWQPPGGDTSLIAHVVVDAADNLSVEERYLPCLRAQLPEWLVPSRIVRLAALPLTPTGKIDRRSLCLPAKGDFPPLGSNLEAQIRSAWETILGHSEFDRNARFFECGGHSLALVRLHRKLRALLGEDFPITLLVEHPTIATQVQAFERRAIPPAQMLSNPNSFATSGMPDDAIAVIGMAGRFPGADNLTDFWQALVTGKECLQHFEEDELRNSGVAENWIGRPEYVPVRGVLDRAEWFDAGFFGYSSREAELMDPQHRVFLETAWTALETAGYDPDRFEGSIGVYAGSSLNTYLLHNLCAHPETRQAFLHGFQAAGSSTLVGNDKDYLASKVSYKLNLRGPSVSVQTACSTSLVAIVHACMALRLGQCDLALAGGVSMTFPQQRGHLYEEGGIASPDGHCRTFDAQAAGTVFGEGTGVVVLKPLRRALVDRDTIWAIVRGEAINNDGSEKLSYLAPSIDGQRKVICTALERAGIPAETLSYVEAHGTGTSLGDPIEVAALTQAFQSQTRRRGFCALGSVKPNIGHLEAAAGVASFIKTVLCLQSRTLPPMLHFQSANPALGLQKSPFFISSECRSWEADSPRRAGVTSLGIGGTNAHVILEEAVPREPPVEPERDRLFLLSARSPTALRTYANNLNRYLQENVQTRLSDLAYTLQMGRKRLPERCVVVATNNAKLREGLMSVSSRHVLSQTHRILFLFPGQGGQYARMGQELYNTQPPFRSAYDACAEIVEPITGIDLRTVLEQERCPRTGKDHSSASLVQPAMVATEYALACLWESWGIKATAMLGHSVGEYVVACRAGVFTLEGMLELVARRAQLVESLPTGAMLAVRAAPETIRAWLPEGVEIAAHNSQVQTVLTGSESGIHQAEQALRNARIASRRLASSYAFHSSLVEPILEAFAGMVADIARKPPRQPYVSSLTGRWVEMEEVVSTEFWVRHLRDPVQFATAIQTVSVEPISVLIECGPGGALRGLFRDVLGAEQNMSSLSSLDEGAECKTFLESVGKLWEAGYEIQPDPGFAEELPSRIPIPTYPFERQRYWVEPPQASESLCIQPEPATWSKPEPAPIQPSMPAPYPEMASSEDDPLTARVYDHLVRYLGDVRERVEPTASFTELGLDSLALTQLARDLQDAFGIPIRFRSLLTEHATIQSLTVYLRKHVFSTGDPGNTSERTNTDLQTSAQFDEKSAELPASFERLLRDQLELLNRQQRLLERCLTSQSPLNDSSSPGISSDGVQVPNLISAKGSQLRSPYLESMIEQITSQTPQSKQLTQHYRGVHADPRTMLGFQENWKELCYPLVVERSKGAYLWDRDGNRYIDLLGGFGANLLGHSPAFLVEELQQQLLRGIEVGPQSPLAGPVAEMLCKMTGTDRASFVCTGSEAVQAALRAARTYTGRNQVAIFARAYHGNFDEVLLRAGLNARPQPSAPGVPSSAIENMVVLEYGDPAALQQIISQANQLAAVLVEPVQSRCPELQPKAFLHALRKITYLHDIVLIFDEVVTGFRLHPRGAQGYFDIQADLVTYGKIVGGGIPLGVVAGRRSVMDVFDGGMWQYGDDSVPLSGRTYFAGTFVRHPLAMAAASAVLQHLSKAGPELQTALNRRGDRLVSAIREVFREARFPMEIVNAGSIIYLRPHEGSKLALLLYPMLRAKGVYLLEGFPGYLSTAHSDEDLESVVEAFRESVAALAPLREDYLERETCSTPVKLPNSTFHEPRGVGQSYPLTEAQQEVWLACQHGEEASCAYLESCSLTIDGPLDGAAMHRALQQLVDRHEALRTRFDRNAPVQQIAPRVSMTMPLHDLSGLSVEEQRNHIAMYLEAEVRSAMDIDRPPLMRSQLLRLHSKDHLLILTFHHLACDGWSIDVLLRELADLYTAAIETRTAQLPASQGIGEYVTAEQAWQATKECQEVDAYWQAQYSNLPAPLELPTDRPRGIEQRFCGSRQSRQLGLDLSQRLEALAQRLQVTTNTVFLSGYAMLLSRLSSQNDLVIGIPVAAQPLFPKARLIGHCVQFLPLRIRLDPAIPAVNTITTIQATLADALENQRFTYARLLRLGRWAKDKCGGPRIRVSFNLDPPFANLSLNGLKVKVEKNPPHYAKLDLHWNILHQDGSYRLECDYRRDLFSPATIERWMDHYCQLLEHLIQAPESRCDELRLLDAPQMEQLIQRWNQTAKSYPAWQRIEVCFEERVLQYPDAFALTDGDRRYRYAELNSLANRLAYYLIDHGVTDDQPVGLCLPRSAESVIGQLAILKAGANYVPFSPDTPVDRVRLLLDQLGIRQILSRYTSANKYAEISAKWLCPELDELRNQYPDHNPTVEGDSSRPAYIMLTSGSTGQPKGVEVPHRAVLKLVYGLPMVRLDSTTVLAHLAPIAFDAATFEVWGALLHGGECVVLPEGHPWPVDLGDYLRRYRVTTLWLTAGLFNTVIDTDPEAIQEIRQLLVGGETLSVEHVRGALQSLPNSELFNGYGPTEATTFSCIYPIPRSLPEGLTSIPIGKPLANTRVYILDTAQKPVPIGVPGELMIAGHGLALGYRNDPERTKKVFCSDPFYPGETMYRSGDRARYLADGTIEFLGRLDRQIKLRGFRIDPEEIEHHLRHHPKISDALVVKATILSGGEMLVAYLVASQPWPHLHEEVMGFLRQYLPEPMLPSQYTLVDRLPLTTNGKVDRLRLPEQVIVPRLEAPPQAAARWSLEGSVVPIWEDVVEMRNLGIEDNFFSLGGHSLLAARVIARIRQQLGQTLPLALLFRCPTVAALARELASYPGRTTYPLTIPLSQISHKQTLFCIPGVGGHVFSFLPLARQLRAPFSVVGLQPPGLDDGRAPIGTIEGLAARFCQEIQLRQPSGPYTLLGYSFGGLVVFEMARQLHGQGAAINWLGIIDTDAPGYPQQRPWWQRLSRHLRQFRKRSRADRWEYLGQRLGKLRSGSRIGSGKVWPPSESSELSEQTRGVIEGQWRAVSQYTGGPYTGSMSLFSSGSLPEWLEMCLPDPQLGWGSLVKGNIESRILPGEHLALLTGQSLNQLVEMLDEILLKTMACKAIGTEIRD